jgi:hypothetical protein
MVRRTIDFPHRNNYFEPMSTKRQTKTSGMSGVWNTQYGPRRVRREPPTVDEAVTAASGLTDDPRQQAEIAASLMDVPVEDVRPAVTRAAAQRKRQVGTVGVAAKSGGQRAVVVERKAARRPGAVRRFNV